MKIGILGSGDVGRALGRGFVELGYEAMIGSGHPDKAELKAWLADNPKNAYVGSFGEATKFGELVVFAVHWEGGAAENVIRQAGRENFAGKVVIDVTNPLHFAEGGAPSLILGHTDSGGEAVQRWLPNAHVVKAWNTVGNAYMYKPNFEEGVPDMFICGNDEQAKNTVIKILGDFGWSSVDIGGIEGARYLEPMAMLWITYGMRMGTWKHAFRLLKK